MIKNVRSKQMKGDGSPMENNQPIAVLNAANEKIGSTYVKRAKGLVKKGRARFIDENTIVLADSGISPCPPDINVYQEDKMMNELAIIKNNAENEENVDCQKNGNLTDAEIFEELKLVRESLMDSETLSLFLNTINATTGIVASNAAGDESYVEINGEKASSPVKVNFNDLQNSAMGTINNINNAREETIRRLIEVYAVLIQKNNK